MISYDQGSGANNGTGAATLTGTISTAGAGRLILLAVAYSSTAALGAAPTIGGSAMTMVAGSTQSGTRLEVWSYLASSALSSAAAVVTLPSALAASMVVDAYAGASGVDGSGAAVNTSTTGTSGTLTTSVTTGAANDVVACYGGLGGGSIPAPGSGYTLTESSQSSNTTAFGEYANAATPAVGTTVGVPYAYSPGMAPGSFIALSISAAPATTPGRRRTAHWV